MKNPNISNRKEELKLLATIIVILLGIVAVVMLMIRVRPSRHMNPDGGSVTVNAELLGSQIAIDRIVEHTTSKNNESYTAYNLDEKPYEISVIRSGFWPWEKTVTPKLKSNLSLNSFSIMITPEKGGIEDTNNERDKYLSTFDTLKVPSESEKLISKDGNVSIWADFNNIFAEWLGDKNKIPTYFCNDGVCNTRINVISSQYNVRSLAFLENRNDVVLFADDHGIYALEIDKTPTQNFQPIYRIAVPQFIVIAPRTMVVESNASMFQLSF